MSASSRWERARTTEDQPDDEPGAYQVHVLYVEPGDRTAPRPLDIDGDLRRSASALNAWLALQADNATFRFDTCNGDVDVTFVKLPSTATESSLASGLDSGTPGPAFLRERLRDLVRDRFNAPNKLYLIVYDGLSYNYCGGAPYPPALTDHYTAIYRGGVFATTFVTAQARPGATEVSVDTTAVLPVPPFAASLEGQQVQVVARGPSTVTLASPLTTVVPAGAMLRAMTTIPPCGDNPYSADGQALGYADFSLLHELMHPLGIVGGGAADFAPAPVAPGHLGEANVAGGDDLMYQGAQPWSCGWTSANARTARCRLDPARRNYWRVDAGPGVVDLARSAFLSPTPTAAQLPAGW